MSNGSLSPHGSAATLVAPVDRYALSCARWHCQTSSLTITLLLECRASLPPGSPCPVEPGELRKKRNSFASLHINRPASKANAISSTDVPGRKELEKTRHLLQDAKNACSAESVTSKIQFALAEVDRLLSLPAGTGATTSVSRCGSFTSSGGSPTPSQALDEIPGAVFVEDSCSVSGDLWKRGLRLRKMIKRHYVLQGNFLYYYAYAWDAFKSQ
ncbi:unnamed protein product [Phytophthora lilii]|uniref:Unnamed protein product n=1 Tax=Phytophthora lilii TaxID=2077276 RepID=A0A9W7CNS9_9STRA|nr:unnamed protein product [Phytophthora lilii]